MVIYDMLGVRILWFIWLCDLDEDQNIFYDKFRVIYCVSVCVYPVVPLCFWVLSHRLLCTVLPKLASAHSLLKCPTYRVRELLVTLLLGLEEKQQVRGKKKKKKKLFPGEMIQGITEPERRTK